MSELRRAARLVVNAPCVIESIGQVPMTLHPNLAAVFRRAHVDTASVGLRFPAIVRDLSTNGAFIAGPPLPLLARVAIKFELRGVGTVDSIGWVLWQRTDDCQIPSPAGTLALPKGFGVLFESVPLETRTAIAALAR
ncbi:MAG TPA: PilZ domain-containing protein [Kofleriaceae bacterium]|jgi:hypothetical protein